MYLVHIPGKNLSHIIISCDDSKAVCDRTVWPGKWEGASATDGSPLCVSCLRKAQAKGGLGRLSPYPYGASN
jgi:hypothetical protein